MFYYKYKDKYLFSLKDDYNYEKAAGIPEECRELYFLSRLDKENSKKSFAVNHPSDLFIEEESLDVLKLDDRRYALPEKILELIEDRKIKAVNTAYEDYEQCFYMNQFKKNKVNIDNIKDG